MFGESPSFRLCRMVLAGFLLAGVASTTQLRAQTLPGLTQADAAALVRRAVDHRTAEEKTHHFLRYELRKIDDRRDTTKEIIETNDGDVARLIAEDGKPLSPEADRAELARLDNLAAHPELQERRHKEESADQKRVSDLLNVLPDAMIYKVQATEPCVSGQCYRISFAPKPGWKGSGLEEDLFRGVSGEVWIDIKQERLVRLDANFIADVNFGLGILARLYKGSTARLEQSDIGPELGGGLHDWELTGLTLHIHGKALLFKSIDVQTKEDASRFALVPDGIGYRDGIKMLKSKGRS